jgi:hypothetical protein
MTVQNHIYHVRNFFPERYLRFLGGKLFFKPAVRKAKRLHEKTGLRYRVFFFKGKYYVCNRSEVRKLMRDGFLKRAKLEADLEKVCFFDTQKNI